MSMFAPGTQRRLLVIGALAFGSFALIAFVVRQAGGSQETVSIIGGAAAYGFLIAAIVILIRGWRNRGAGDREAIGAWLREHPGVVGELGSPVVVGRPGGDALGPGHGQANVVVPLSGPAGRGVAQLSLARLGREWEILGGVLEVRGERMPLSARVSSDAS